MTKPEPLNIPAMTEEELQTALLVELATIENLKGDTIRRSGEFWKAVENRNKIQFELKRLCS